MAAFGLKTREGIEWMGPIFIQSTGVRKRFAARVSCLLVWKTHSTENMGSNYKEERETCDVYVYLYVSTSTLLPLGDIC